MANRCLSDVPLNAMHWHRAGNHTSDANEGRENPPACADGFELRQALTCLEVRIPVNVTGDFGDRDRLRTA